MGLQRVRHDWLHACTHTHTCNFCAFLCVYINTDVYFLKGNFPSLFADAVIHMYIFTYIFSKGYISFLVEKVFHECQ